MNLGLHTFGGSLNYWLQIDLEFFSLLFLWMLPTTSKFVFNQNRFIKFGWNLQSISFLLKLCPEKNVLLGIWIINQTEKGSHMSSFSVLRTTINNWRNICQLRRGCCLLLYSRMFSRRTYWRMKGNSFLYSPFIFSYSTYVWRQWITKKKKKSDLN